MAKIQQHTLRRTIPNTLRLCLCVWQRRVSKTSGGCEHLHLCVCVSYQKWNGTAVSVAVLEWSQTLSLTTSRPHSFYLTLSHAAFPCTTLHHIHVQELIKRFRFQKWNTESKLQWGNAARHQWQNGHKQALFQNLVSCLADYSLHRQHSNWVTDLEHSMPYVKQIVLKSASTNSNKHTYKTILHKIYIG